MKEKNSNLFLWKLLSILLFVILVFSVLTNGFGLKIALFKPSAEKIAQEAVDFIENNLVQPGISMTNLMIHVSPEMENFYFLM